MKTRLGKDLGHPRAVEIYKKLLTITRTAALQVNADRQLHYGDYINTKDDWPARDFHKVLQEGANLGDRMFKAFTDGFDQGYKQVVIIGSDCPEIDAETLQRAFDELKAHDAVIGPANDGGYYLLGLSQKVNIFADIEWSTESVFEETVEQIKKHGLSYTVLPEKTDLDTIEDLKKFPHL
ncbi:MAG: TIGR04282 family arsenosugar biosynthesis glycosyltransferase [Owenweeksia sp.]